VRLIAATAGLAMVAFSAGAAGPGVAEYDLKAAFTIRFLHFIEWPEEAFPGPKTPLIVGVFGSNPFDGALHQNARGQSLRERPIEIRHIRLLREAAHCHVLFISRSAGNHVPEILAALEGKPVLTVGDSDGLAERGVIINMFIEDSKVRFEINQAAALKSKLQISSRLLRLARLAGGEAIDR
jgi:hypothetical protein